jgi:hypothetical protein
VGAAARPLARDYFSAMSAQPFAGDGVHQGERDPFDQPRPGRTGRAPARAVSFASLRTSFDRALRTVKEYNEKVEYIHWNPVTAGLVRRPEDWTWSSVHDFTGSVSAAGMGSAIPVDRILMPSNERTRI